ncbi:MAG: hypothetical protein KDJ66_06375 [Nitratireductor sp.]|nr:hypothetical protein [Nitratireductor sp.]
MSSLTLEAPKPETSLKATVVTQLNARATILGDTLNAYGMHERQIRIAQEGFAEGQICGVTIYGLNARGQVEDEAALWFDAIKRETSLSLDLSNGRSLTEAVSRQLARHIVFSAETMKRKNLNIQFAYWFPGNINHEAARARYGLVASSGYSYAPGHARRRLFQVTPGLDTGVHFAHYQARRLR